MFFVPETFGPLPGVPRYFKSKVWLIPDLIMVRRPLQLLLSPENELFLVSSSPENPIPADKNVFLVPGRDFGSGYVILDRVKY